MYKMYFFYIILVSVLFILESVIFVSFYIEPWLKLVKSIFSPLRELDLSFYFELC